MGEGQEPGYAERVTQLRVEDDAWTMSQEGTPGRALQQEVTT